MVCPFCGSSVAGGAKFCVNCGARLGAQQQQQYQYQQQPQQQQYQQGYQQQNYQQQNYQQQGQQQQWYQQQQGQPQYQQQQQQQYQYQPPQGGAPSAGRVDFIEAIRLYFLNYANFTGRASKSEYWWSVLFLFLAGLAAGIVDGLIGASVFTAILNVGTLVPSLAILVRRLHDIGKPWPWIFMALIPFAGFIIMIVYCCRPSDGDNRWGPGPRY